MTIGLGRSLAGRNTETRFLSIQEAIGQSGTWQPISTTETIRWIVKLRDMHPRSFVNIKVHWSTKSTTLADTVTWRVRYASITENTEALKDVTVSALDTTIAADNAVATANAVLVTSKGLINPGNVSPNEPLLLELNAQTLSGIVLGDANQVDDVHVYGIEIEYRAQD